MMSHGIATLLISSAVGYWVLTAAGREKNRVKTLGLWLGLLIIIISLAGAACKIACAIQTCQMGRSGGAMMGGKACPFGSKGEGYGKGFGHHKKMGMMCPAGHAGCTNDCPSTVESPQG